MKKGFAILFLQLAFTFHINAQYHHAINQFVIAGHINGIVPQKIYLFQTKDGVDITDSTVIKNGKFRFKGHAGKEPTLAYLMLPTDNGSEYLFFFIEPGDISVNTWAQSFFTGSVSGTVVNNDMQRFNAAQGSFHLKLYLIEKEIRDATNADDQQKLDSLTSEHSVAELQLKSLGKTFIRNNPDAYFSGYLMYKLSSQIDSSFNSLYHDLSTKVKRSQYCLLYNKAWSDFAKVKIGSQSPDFISNDQYDKTVQLSSFKGKYVLLTFWASWCPPCRHENHMLNDIYDTERSKKVAFISISLDENKGDWLAAIKTDNIHWPSLLSLRNGKKSIAELFGVNDVPQNILLNKDQIVIAKNIPVDQIEKIINGLIK
jgi:thiol-disulfide isomerase/thioredoxin